MCKNQSSNSFRVKNSSGLKLVVASFGILCGLTGMIAGVFMVLQGNIPTNGYVISTIGPEYTMYKDFTYYAITIVPNFLISGILAIITSSLVIIWSLRYVHRRNGALVLLILSITQMLVGGGWVIDLAIITFILATRIGKPLEWWSRIIPDIVQVRLARVFPYSVVGFVLVSLCMLVLTVVGVNSESLIKLLEPLAIVMFFPIILMTLGGITVEKKWLMKKN